MNKLQLLKSDLKDARDSKIIRKYPHLSNPAYIAELEKKISELEKK